MLNYGHIPPTLDFSYLVALQNYHLYLAFDAHTLGPSREARLRERKFQNTSNPNSPLRPDFFVFLLQNGVMMTNVSRPKGKLGAARRHNFLGFFV